MTQEQIKSLIDEEIVKCAKVFDAKKGQYGNSFVWYNDRALVDKVFAKALSAKIDKCVDETGYFDFEACVERYQSIVNYADMIIARYIGLPRIDELIHQKSSYNNAWMHYHLDTFACEIAVKCARWQNAGVPNVLTSDAFRKFISDMEDIVVYALFALTSLNNELGSSPDNA